MSDIVQQTNVHYPWQIFNQKRTSAYLKINLEYFEHLIEPSNPNTLAIFGRFSVYF